MEIANRRLIKGTPHIFLILVNVRFLKSTKIAFLGAGGKTSRKE